MTPDSIGQNCPNVKAMKKSRLPAQAGIRPALPNCNKNSSPALSRGRADETDRFDLTD
jgi:hypothetical protein